MAIYLGDATPSTFRLGDSQVDAIYLGDTKVWSNQIPVSMGMDKSGTQLIPQNTWTDLVNFTVRSGFSNTVITNHALDFTGAGGLGTFTFRGAFGAALGTQQFRVTVNGTPIGSAANQATVGTISNFTLDPGDQVKLQGFSSIASDSWRTVSAGSSATYLYFTLA